MSTNCIKCVVNRHLGIDLLCDSCRRLRLEQTPSVRAHGTGDSFVNGIDFDEFVEAFSAGVIR